MDQATDTEVVDEPAINRVPTKPIVASRLEVDLADPDTVAHFLEFAARLVRSSDPDAVGRFLEFCARVARTKGRIVVTVE